MRVYIKINYATAELLSDDSSNLKISNEDEDKKKKTPQSCSISKLPNGDIESSGGFKFADQSIIDIIASCFGSKESEAKLKKIHDEAKKLLILHKKNNISKNKSGIMLKK